MSTEYAEKVKCLTHRNREADGETDVAMRSTEEPLGP